jgi:hypothetical protein
VGATDEAAVMAFLAELNGEQWDAAQIERTLDYLSPEVRYHIYVWEDPMIGRDAIRAVWLRQAELFHDFRSEIATIGSVGQTVLVENANFLHDLDRYPGDTPYRRCLRDGSRRKDRCMARLLGQ